jgi:hypothetical protein
MTNKTSFQRALLLSTALPAAFMLAPSAHARDVTVLAPVAPATSVSGDSVNAAIVAAITAPNDAKLTLVAPSTAVVSGASVVLNPAEGQGDGAVIFTNDGKFGSVNATTGAVTESVGTFFNGRAAAGAGNSFTGKNNSGGLITGGLGASGFGGAVSVTNDGTIHGGIAAEGNGGDVAVKNGGTVNGGIVASGKGAVAVATTGTVLSGGVFADALESEKAETKDGVTSTTYTGGAATIEVQGDVASKDGTSRGPVSASGLGGATVTVNAKAGGVFATSYDLTSTVAQPYTPAANGKSAQVSQNDLTYGGGAASVAVGEGGDVSGVTVKGIGGATATVAGNVVGEVSANALDTAANGFASPVSIRGVYKNNVAETRNADGFVTQTVANRSTAPVGAAASVAVAEAGTVGGSVSATGLTSASAQIDGSVAFGVSANSVATGIATTTKTLFDDKGVRTQTITSTTRAPAGGTASVTVSKTGEVGGSLTANGDAGATVTNGGNVEGGVSATSRRQLQVSNASDVTDTKADGSYATTTSTEERWVGGAVAVTNDKGGLIQSGVTVNALGDITIVNNGVVRGATSASSAGSTFKRDTVSIGTVSVAKGTAPAPDITTRLIKTSDIRSTSVTGGSVTGTYAGANGTLNFDDPTTGSVSQSANKDSTATVTGAVYGNLTSTAGTGTNSNYAETTENSSVRSSEVPSNGSDSFKRTRQSTSASAAGTSKVVITGTVGSGNTGAAGSVTSNGTTASSVTVDGGKVGGNVISGGHVTSTTFDSVETTDTVFAKGATTLLGYDYSYQESNSTTQSGGAASASVLGTGKVDGGVSVNGLASAAAVIGSRAQAGSAFVSTAGHTDTTYAQDYTYVVDAEGATTATSNSTSTSKAAAAGGDATLDMAGTLLGDATVAAGQGNASAKITGIVDGGSVFAVTGGTFSTVQNAYEFAATPKGVSTSKSTTTTTSVAQGGTTTIVVDSASAFKNKGLSGVTGDLYASGLGGASVSVAAGNEIGGSVLAFSDGSDTSEQTVTTFAADGQFDSIYRSATTARGGVASVANAGDIAGSVYAVGRTSASIVNTGILGSDDLGNLFQVAAQGYDRTAVEEETHLENAALRRFVGTYSITPVGGDASFTNGVDAIANGDVVVGGLTGLVTNNGVITGTTFLGQSALYGSAVVDATETSTAVTITPTETLLSQKYVVNQNGVSGDISVGGATVTQADVASYLSAQVGSKGIVIDPADIDPAKFTLTVGGEKALKTSAIEAIINLNDGSETGNIFAQRDDSGAYLTNTTVNLTNAGSLGGIGDGDRILGVTALNKTGAGVFTIHGAAYAPAEALELLPDWTLDVGNFNIQQGEVQLSVDGDDAVPVFGIKGNVTNAATLVLGTRVPAEVKRFGDSLVSAGPAVDGVAIYQKGNFTQEATGTLVVNLKPSLLRYSPLEIPGSSNSGEVLGPVSASVDVYYFSTPDNLLGANYANSTVLVDGDLKLGGKVALAVSKDSLFSNGDGYTLFTYTGTYTGGATVAPSLASPFISFGLTNDAAGKTVKIAATRASYATGANNPNAASAATGLDSTLATVIGKIKTDAAGGSAFASVTELGYAQDVANIASGLDWRLSAAGAAQVFNELSSAEIYGSLAAIEQNSALTESFETASSIGSTGLWINPVGRFARYGGTKSGASRIRDNSYGGAIGLNLGYGADGGFGIGFAYAEHDITARGTPETAKAKTYSIGVNWKHVFGPIQAGAQFVYGFSNFDVTRDLTVLDRTITAAFKGRQWDGNIELGYDVLAGSGVTVLPFGKLAVRHWTLGGFTEQGGAGIGLTASGDSKTVFVPELGVRLGAELSNGGDVSIRPFGKLSYTFQGDVGSNRTFAYAAGGTPFTLEGVDPKGFGSIDGGISALFKERVGVFVQGGLNFGGSQKGAEVRGGINVRF